VSRGLGDVYKRQLITQKPEMKQPIRLSNGADVKPSINIKKATEKGKKDIIETFDAIIASEACYNELGKSNWYDSRNANITPEGIENKIFLKRAMKKRNWRTYNELAYEFSQRRKCDVVEALFERVTDVALGEIKDQNDSAKYAVLLLNTIFDEKKQLGAQPGYRLPVATVDDINESSKRVVELLMEGSISLEVAERFQKLLVSRLNILQDTVICEELEQLKKHVGLS
jgi:hypothetical protein